MTRTAGHGAASIRQALTIAELELRRLFRQRLNAFWLVLAPLLFVLVLGVLLGGGHSPRLAVVHDDQDPMARELVAALAADGRFEVVQLDNPTTLRAQVERGQAQAGLMIPPGLAAQVHRGDQTMITLLARPDDVRGAELSLWAEAVINQQGVLVNAARFAAEQGAGTLPDNLAQATTLDTPQVTVVSTTTGVASFPDGLNPFAVMAPSLLLMYVFLTSLTAAQRMIEARRRGILTAMYATPTPVNAIVAGEALGRFGIALAQGLIVMLGSALLFGVDWGDPTGAALLLVSFCLVGSGAAMLLGSLLRSEGPAMGVAIGAGLGLAALGGVMVPLEMLDETMRTIALVTPHAWAYNGFSELVRHGGGLRDILPQLGALAGFAVALFAAGIWQLRRSIVAAPGS